MEEPRRVRCAAPEHGLDHLAKALADGLSCAMVADSLDEVGLRHQVMNADIQPVGPGSRMIGRARTAQFLPTLAGDDPYASAVDFIDSIRAGEAIVLATGGDVRSAYWGELFSAAALGRGAVGTVCDGPVRDTAKVRALGFALFSRGARPIDFCGRMRLVATDVPVNCGGVLVNAGDTVIADDDGIAVVPASAANEVFDRALSRMSTEGDVLDALRAGASLQKVWDTWRVL